MNTLVKFLMTFINKNNVFSAENVNVISFRDFRNFRKTFNREPGTNYVNISHESKTVGYSEHVF